jgi:hypothetical protein
MIAMRSSLIMAKRFILLGCMLCALAGLPALEWRVGASGGVSADWYLGSYLSGKQSDLEAIYGSAASSLTNSPGLGYRADLACEAVINQYLGLDAELGAGYYGGGLVSSSVAIWESATALGFNLLARGFYPLNSGFTLSGALGGGVAFLPAGLTELVSAYSVSSSTTLSSSVFGSAIADFSCDVPLNIPNFIPLTARASIRCEYAWSFLDSDSYGSLTPLSVLLNLSFWYTLPHEVKK